MRVDTRFVTAIQLVVLVAYSGGLVLLGLWLSRRVEGSRSFFVADRRLGAGLVFSTFLAANIGAGSIIGASGLGYATGISAWWWVGSAGIGSLLLAFWVGPRIWRVAKAHDLYTAGDFLEHRYGSSVRAVVASLLWLLTLVILAAQLIAMSQILEWVLGVPRWVGAVLGGVVVTTYFAAGGLLTSAWVNLVQLVILLGGFAIGVPLALSRAGGWDAVVAAAPDDPAYLDIFAQTGVIFFVLIVPAFIVSPGLLQKAFGAVDERTVRIGVGLQGLVLLLFAFAPPLVGMIARIYVPELSNPEFAVPTVLTLGLPTLFGALGLAAVFSAELSSADAILFMLATSLSKDIYKRYAAPEADDRRVLRAARGAAVVGGLFAVALAVVIPTVIDSLKVFYSVLSVSLFVPVVAGLHSRRPGIPEALAAIGVGVATLFAVRISSLGTVSLWLDPTALGIAASAVAFGVAYAVRRRRGPSLEGEPTEQDGSPLLPHRRSSSEARGHSETPRQ
ncbi:MAG: sodium:solute symporter family protein [Longimicrobiales bacterium]|nr:sodium:solute symporter family protein [Longimicrobiales bacterium]